MLAQSSCKKSDITNIENGYVKIPDQNFEKYLIDEGLDIEGLLDGKISQSNAKNIIYIHLGIIIEVNNEKLIKYPVKDFSGIEHFTNLKELSLSVFSFFDSNPSLGLTSLNISKNVNLEWLEISHNKLKTIDLTNNPKLKYLNCGKNQLKSLDLSKNLLLESLDFSDNFISNLDLRVKS